MTNYSRVIKRFLDACDAANRHPEIDEVSFFLVGVVTVLLEQGDKEGSDYFCRLMDSLQNLPRDQEDHRTKRIRNILENMG